MMKHLIQQAEKFRKNAHAPFSKFLVGAAISVNNNVIIGGCNVESHSYGLTICAERNVIFQAISQGYKSFTALAIATTQHTTPCGACRQIIAELCGNIPIYTYNINTQHTQTFYAFDLIPEQFSLHQTQSSVQDVCNEQFK
jgi:cytidine deaminase